MLSKSKLPYLFLVLLAIGLGVAWGLRIRRTHEVRKAPESDAATLKVLALKNAFPLEILRVFEAQRNLKVTLTEKNDPDEIAAALEVDQSFDLVTLMSSQASAASQSLKAQPIAPSDISGFSLITADCLDLPGFEHVPSSVPLFWGVTGIAYSPSVLEEKRTTSWATLLKDIPKKEIELKPSRLNLVQLAASISTDASEGDAAIVARAQRLRTESSLSTSFLYRAEEGATTFRIRQIQLSESLFPPYSTDHWTFALPDEKAPMWVMVLMMGAKSENAAGAKLFVQHLLKPQIATELSIRGHQASCNKGVETISTLDEKLKPSYLRALPLGRIQAASEKDAERAKLIH